MGLQLYLNGKSKAWLVMVAGFFALLIGLADYLTGYEMRMEIFYLIPIAFSAWYGGRQAGFLMAGPSALLIAFADFLSGKPYQRLFIEFWNLAIYLSFFIVVAFLLHQLRTTLRERLRLVQDLQQALREVKELQGILPICSSCKKIRNDEGYWEHVEEYIGSHTKAQFTHGLCLDCAERLYPELMKKYGKDKP